MVKQVAYRPNLQDMICGSEGSGASPPMRSLGQKAFCRLQKLRSLNVLHMFRSHKKGKTITTFLRVELQHPYLSLSFWWNSSFRESTTAGDVLGSSKTVRMFGILKMNSVAMKLRRHCEAWKKSRRKHLGAPLIPANPERCVANKGLRQSRISNFASKSEKSAMVVQVGVVSTLLVLVQLALAEVMPRMAIGVVALGIGGGVILICLIYTNKIIPEIWTRWKEAMTIEGGTALPQLIQSNIRNKLPQSVFDILGVTMILLARLNELAGKTETIVQSVAAWSTTLLTMWTPVAQWWANYFLADNM